MAAGMQRTRCPAVRIFQKTDGVLLLAKVSRPTNFD